MSSNNPAQFNFYLNRQGAQGKQGEKGDQGFSPSITEGKNTLSEYTLLITNQTGTFETTNLREHKEDRQGTYMRYDRTKGVEYAGAADVATEDNAGVVRLSGQDDFDNLGDETVLTPYRMATANPLNLAYVDNLDETNSGTKAMTRFETDIQTSESGGVTSTTIASDIYRYTERWINGMLDDFDKDYYLRQGTVKSTDGSITITPQQEKGIDLSVNFPPAYTLPIATQTTLGGIKIGEGLEISEDGTVTVTGGGGGSPANMVTTDTEQTISGEKTFTSSIHIDNDILTSDGFRIANGGLGDDRVSIGDSNAGLTFYSNNDIKVSNNTTEETLIHTGNIGDYAATTEDLANKADKFNAVTPIEYDSSSRNSLYNFEVVANNLQMTSAANDMRYSTKSASKGQMSIITYDTLSNINNGTYGAYIDMPFKIGQVYTFEAAQDNYMGVPYTENVIFGNTDKDGKFYPTFWVNPYYSGNCKIEVVNSRNATESGHYRNFSSTPHTCLSYQDYSNSSRTANQGIVQFYKEGENLIVAIPSGTGLTTTRVATFNYNDVQAAIESTNTVRITAPFASDEGGSSNPFNASFFGIYNYAGKITNQLVTDLGDNIYTLGETIVGNNLTLNSAFLGGTSTAVTLGNSGSDTTIYASGDIKAVINGSTSTTIATQLDLQAVVDEIGSTTDALEALDAVAVVKDDVATIVNGIYPSASRKINILSQITESGATYTPTTAGILCIGKVSGTTSGQMMSITSASQYMRDYAYCHADGEVLACNLPVVANFPWIITYTTASLTYAYFYPYNIPTIS